MLSPQFSLDLHREITVGPPLARVIVAANYNEMSEADALEAA